MRRRKYGISPITERLRSTADGAQAAADLIGAAAAGLAAAQALKHTCVPAEYTANDQGAVPGIQAGGQQEGDKGRQMNLSARRAVPDIQAGRQTIQSTGASGIFSSGPCSIDDVWDGAPVRRLLLFETCLASTSGRNVKHLARNP